MWTRRDVLKLGAGTLLSSGLAPRLSLARAAEGGPRYFVVIFLRGGLDSTFTTDPRVRAEVADNIDVPYGADDIVEAEGGGLRFGPHFSELAPYGSRLAVLNGLQVRTANHESGARQMLRLKTAVSINMPSLLDVIGTTRDEQPLASVTLGSAGAHEHSPAGFAAPTHGSTGTVLDKLDLAAPADLELLERTYRRHAERARGWTASLQRDATVDHLGQAADLFRRMQTVAPYSPEEWSSGRKQRLAGDLQRTLWLLENDMTKGAYIKVVFGWDTHYRNSARQRSATRAFVPMFARFLDELRSRSNAHGRLSDNTLVVVGSELGRFPVLNSDAGKDHFPEATFLFSGPCIDTGDGKGARYGDTGRRMEGLPVSLETGRQVATGGTHLVLDDVGTTLLHMAGLDPARYGYRGRRLRFLERT